MFEPGILVLDIKFEGLWPVSRLCVQQWSCIAFKGAYLSSDVLVFSCLRWWFRELSHRDRV